jgi:mannose-6-phosphate isomerase-like protein (cupin superfamily)
MSFETIPLPEKYNYLAPDGSEIRLLPGMQGGSLCHCTLPAGKTAAAVAHKTVEEIWYILQGEGEVWRKLGEQAEVTPVHSGISLTIPLGTHFQFRNTGSEPLCILITTMPPWPGDGEAYSVPGKW